MSIALISNFETGDFSDWTTVGYAWEIFSTGEFIEPCHGNYCGGNYLWTGELIKDFSTGAAEWVVGVAFNSTANWQSVAESGWPQQWLSFYNGTTRHCFIAWDKKGSGAKMGLYDNAKNLLWQESASYSLNTYYFYEFKVKIDATAGAITFRRNGVPAGSETGLNTKNSGATATVNRIRFDSVLSGSAIDDFYAVKVDGTGDNDFLGNLKKMPAVSVIT